ncbi:MAG: hypothetical protein GXO87_02395 [Chlorobi bacterium]|nr:hypothetical protein [Chlorobiota bacterium]
MIITLNQLYKISLFLILSVISVIILYFGWDYYTLPLNKRFFSELHTLLKPSGALGHGFGIIGSLMMLVGVVSYMIRKRVKRFSRLGALKNWLIFHIFLCTLGPILVLYHTAFKFGGLVSISFWSMAAVVVSGFIGRFIYLQIPRTIEGNELSFNDVNKLNINLTQRLRENYNLSESILLMIDEFSFVDLEEIKLSSAISSFIKKTIEQRKALKKIKSVLKKSEISKENRKEVIRLIKSKLVLTRKISLLKSMQKLFGYWHVAHLPFAILMLLIMLVHVGVTIVFGYRWVF